VKDLYLSGPHRPASGEAHYAVTHWQTVTRAARPSPPGAFPASESNLFRLPSRYRDQLERYLGTGPGLAVTVVQVDSATRTTVVRPLLP
jgi:hypothetical protein